MYSPELDALARESLPGQGAVRIKRLSRGMHHETFLVARGVERYSLRVAKHGSLVSREDADFEARVLAVAGAQGLSPPLISADPQRGVLVLGWLEGQPWSEASIPSSERIIELAGLLRRVHRLAVPKPWRVLGPGDWIARYRGRLAADGRVALDTLTTQADGFLQAWANLPPSVAVVCHSDLHRLNLLESNGTQERGITRLLDWEYAHVSDPFWDLAGWGANNGFGAESAERLLSAYLGGPPTPAQWRRYRLLCWLFDYTCLMWSLLNLTPAAASPEPELAARARLLETRLAAAVYGKLVEE